MCVNSSRETGIITIAAGLGVLLMCFGLYMGVEVGKSIGRLEMYTAYQEKTIETVTPDGIKYSYEKLKMDKELKAKYNIPEGTR